MPSPFPGMDPWIENAEYFRSRTAEVYPIPLTGPLPLFAIPLSKGDSDVTVGLQPAFDRSYDVARFDQRAAYGEPCDPPLTAERQNWAEGILKAKGLLGQTDS